MASKDGLVTKFKELFRFYKAGIKSVFRNRAEAKILKAKQKQGIALTRREFRFILKSKEDTYKLAPFSILLFILPEAIPFLVVFAPQFIPSTCVTDEQLMKKRIKLQERRDNTTQIALRSTQKSELLPVTDFITVNKLLRTAKVYHDAFAYELIKRKSLQAYGKFMGISTWAPSSIVANRLKARFRYLREDDALLKSEGIDYLTPEELIEANEERGMRTLNQTDGQLRQTLNDWITVSLSQSPPVPDLLLILSRVFLNNIRTKDES